MLFATFSQELVFLSSKESSSIILGRNTVLLKWRETSTWLSISERSGHVVRLNNTWLRVQSLRLWMVLLSYMEEFPPRRTYFVASLWGHTCSPTGHGHYRFGEPLREHRQPSHAGGRLQLLRSLLPVQGVWAQSLVWELRPHMPCGQKIKT